MGGAWLAGAAPSYYYFINEDHIEHWKERKMEGKENGRKGKWEENDG